MYICVCNAIRECELGAVSVQGKYGKALRIGLPRPNGLARGHIPENHPAHGIGGQQLPALGQQAPPYPKTKLPSKGAHNLQSKAPSKAGSIKKSHAPPPTGARACL